MALSEEMIVEIRRQLDRHLAEFEAQQSIKIAAEIEQREAQREEASLRRMQFWTAVMGLSGFALISGFAIWLTNSVETTARTTTQTVLEEAESEAKLAAGVSKIQEAAVERLLSASDAVAQARQTSKNAAAEAERYEAATKDAQKQGAEIVARIESMERDVESFEQFAERLRVARETDAELKEIIREIASDPVIQARVVAEALPEGAVVAFARECPTEQGWVRYEQAAARFIIGAATAAELDLGPAVMRSGSNGQPLNERQLGTHDGTEMVRLTIDEMPSHAHRFTYRPSRKHGGDDWAVKASSGPLGGIAVEEGTTDPIGGGRPHYNMPPYVALYYCRNEG